jgi:hypothetical protein
MTDLGLDDRLIAVLDTYAAEKASAPMEDDDLISRTKYDATATHWIMSWRQGYRRKE